jgi:hypothetical protein
VLRRPSKTVGAEGLGRQLNRYRKISANADGDPAEKNEELHIKVHRLGNFDQLIAEL